MLPLFFMSLTKLFILFVKIGAILLGGGYVILPILKSEFVDKSNLISEEELKKKTGSELGDGNPDEAQAAMAAGGSSNTDAE